MSQHSSADAITTSGEDLRLAAEQVHLAGFTKTWTHLLAAAAAVLVAAMTDGRITALECLQIFAILCTAVLTWAVPGTVGKTLITLVGVGAGAAAPYFVFGWSGLTGANIALMLVAVLGAISSMLLPNTTPTALTVGGGTPVATQVSWHAVAAAAIEEVKKKEPTPSQQEDTPAQPVRETSELAWVPASSTPAVPPVEASTVSAVERLRQRRAKNKAEQAAEAEEAPLTSSPPASIRSSYLPPGSGATSVLPAQPPASSSGGGDDLAPRGYDFGRS